MQKTTVKRLKELVQEETGIEPEHQRLLYGPKQMEDDKRLCDYPPLGNGASILLVLRLPGGGQFFSSNNNSVSTSSPRMHSTTVIHDRRLAASPTTTTSPRKSLSPDTSDDSEAQNDDEVWQIDAASSAGDGPPAIPSVLSRKIPDSLPRCDEDCMIMLTSSDTLRMPCGHPMCPDGLMEYCWSEIKAKKFEIKCPLCATEWPLEILKLYGCASEVEMTELESGLARCACLKDPNTQQCPFCGVFCVRMNTSSNNVNCIQCSRKAGKAKEFCWICLQPWIAPSSAERCGNQECDVTRNKLKRLQDSPMTGVLFFPGKKIYKLRACPECGTIIELESGCKHMMCTACSTDFCFICLRQRVCSNWPCGSYNTPCELAPIQLAIPKH